METSRDQALIVPRSDHTRAGMSDWMLHFKRMRSRHAFDPVYSSTIRSSLRDYWSVTQVCLEMLSAHVNALTDPMIAAGIFLLMLLIGLLASPDYTIQCRDLIGEWRERWGPTTLCKRQRGEFAERPGHKLDG